MSLLDHGQNYHGLLSDWLARPRVRFVTLTIYYLAILLGLIVLYGQANFSAPNFVYQNF